MPGGQAQELQTSSALHSRTEQWLWEVAWEVWPRQRCCQSTLIMSL